MVDGLMYNLDMEDDRGRFDEVDKELPQWAEFANGELHVERQADAKANKAKAGEANKAKAKATWYDHVFAHRKPAKDFRKHIDKVTMTHSRCPDSPTWLIVVTRRPCTSTVTN